MELIHRQHRVQEIYSGTFYEITVDQWGERYEVFEVCVGNMMPIAGIGRSFLTLAIALSAGHALARLVIDG